MIEVEAADNFLNWMATAPVADYRFLAGLIVVVWVWLYKSLVVGQAAGRPMRVIVPLMIALPPVGFVAVSPPPGPNLTPLMLIIAVWLFWLGYELAWRHRPLHDRKFNEFVTQGGYTQANSTGLQHAVESKGATFDHNTTTGQGRPNPNETVNPTQNRLKPPKVL
jgi:hypothetical protein